MSCNLQDLNVGAELVSRGYADWVTDEDTVSTKSDGEARSASPTDSRKSTPQVL